MVHRERPRPAWCFAFVFASSAATRRPSSAGNLAGVALGTCRGWLGSPLARSRSLVACPLPLRRHARVPNAVRCCGSMHHPFAAGAGSEEHAARAGASGQALWRTHGPARPTNRRAVSHAAASWRRLGQFPRSWLPRQQPCRQLHHRWSVVSRAPAVLQDMWNRMG